MTAGHMLKASLPGQDILKNSGLFIIVNWFNFSMLKIKVVNFGLALIVSLFFQVALMEVTVKFFPRFKENSVAGIPQTLLILPCPG